MRGERDDSCSSTENRVDRYPRSCRVSGSKDQMLGLGEFNSIVLSCAKDSSNWGVTSSRVYIP